jgi:hypothetical protein
MPLDNLLGLRNEDLILLSNQGVVKRAIKELESQNLTYELIDNKQQIKVIWSDGIECILTSEEKISDRHCSCSATNICRHLIRSILLYQSQYSSSQTNHPQPWNPGNIRDLELASHYSQRNITYYKKQFASGQLVEVICGSQPVAKFHTSAHTVRFLVPGDIRYTHCDCTETSPCRHILYAIWAFRLLEKNQSSGIISTQINPLPIPLELLDEIERALQELLILGIKGITPSLIGRWQRLQQQCLQVELIWLAEIISELLVESELYINRDARFWPVKVVRLIGELCIRSDAIRHNIDSVPQIFIRGAKGDRLTDMDTAKLIGLGCGVRVKKQSAILTAYLQDSYSGTVVAVEREFIDTQEGELLCFSKLAQKSLFKNISFANFAAGQVLSKGGKRAPNCQFIPGKKTIAITPQTFQWMELSSFLLVEEFSILQAHLQLLPPPCLRGRRLTEDFYVLAVNDIQSVRFSSREQAITALLLDRDRHSINLYFPYHYRASIGTEVLLKWLKHSQIKFVAGRVYLSASGLTIEPVSIVKQEGTTNYMLQPWIAIDNEESAPIQSSEASVPILEPLQYYLEQLESTLSDLCAIGIEKIDFKTIDDWQKIKLFGEQLGLRYLTNKCTRLLDCLYEVNRQNEKSSQIQSLATIILEIAVLTQMSLY